MKKNNKKKRLPGYWLGTKKPTSLGYQPNYGIGNALFTSVEGEDLNPEVRAAKRNILPNTLNKLTKQGGSLANILSNTTKTAIPTTTINASAAAAAKAANSIAAGGVGTRLAANGGADYMGSMFTSSNGTNLLGQTAGETAAQTGAKTVLNAAGTTLSALGTAYGLYDIYNQFANAGDHRSISDMRNTLTTNTYTTDRGNQYTEYTGLNRQAELDYERAQRLLKQLNLGISSIGTGASAGALLGSTILPGIGTGLGTALGAGVGALFSGISSLFGFGNNEDEIKEQMRILADTTSRLNRQSKSLAENQDMKDAFYGRAAKGKQPVYSEFGPTNRKETAYVSNGELIGRFKKGRPGEIESQYVVPGPVNNKTKFADNKKANVQDETYIVSNLDIPGTNVPLSAYALATGDVLGALNVQNKMNTNKKKDLFKCGKKPGYALGTLGEYALATLPHLGSYFSNLAQYNRAKHANKYVPLFEIQNPESSAAINQVMYDMIDPREYLNQSNNAYRQAAWNLQRNPAMGLGGRMVMLDALNRAKFAQDAQTRMKIDEANRAQRNVGAQMRDQMGRDLLAKRYDNMWRRHRAAQEANAAQENWLAQYRKNMDTALVSGAADALRMLQYNKANDIQNKMLGIYQQNADVEKLRALKEVYGTVPADSTTPTTAAAPASTTTTSATDNTGTTAPSLFNLYTIGGKPGFNPSRWNVFASNLYGPKYYYNNPYISYTKPAVINSSIAVDDRFRGPGRYTYEQPWSQIDKDYMNKLHFGI